MRLGEETPTDNKAEEIKVPSTGDGQKTAVKTRGVIEGGRESEGKVWHCGGGGGVGGVGGGRGHSEAWQHSAPSALVAFSLPAPTFHASAVVAPSNIRPHV